MKGNDLKIRSAQAANYRLFRANRRGVSRLAAWATISVLGVSLLTAGCGSGGGTAPTPFAGGGGAAASRAKGEVSFTVTWPDRSGRLIPIASESIVLTLTRNPAPGLPNPQPIVKTLVRPAAGQPLTTTTTFSGLELGDYIAVVGAYPNPDGTGNAQAAGPGAGRTGTAAVPVTVKAGVNPGLTITLNSTIANLAVLPPTGTRLRASEQRTFTATATDVNGSLVVVNRSIQWSVSSPNLFKLVTNGNIATISYIGPTPLTQNATAIVTATDPESGKTSSATAVYAVTGLADINNGWPKFHGNAQNTGQASSSVTGDATLGTQVALFTTPKNDPVVFSSPAVGADGTIYVGAYDGNLYALTRNGASLDIKWVFHTGGIIEASPTIGADGTVYIGSFDGNVYALAGEQPDPANVKPLWVFPAGGPVQSSPALDPQGFVYVGGTDTDNNLYKLDGFTGALIWTFTANGGIQTVPAFTPDYRLVVVGSLDGNVYIVNTNTGTLAASPFATGAQIFSSSAAIAKVGGKDTAFIGSTNGIVYAVGAQFGDAQLGRGIWAIPFNANAPIYSSPAVATDNSGNATAVYVGSFDNVTGTANSRLFRLNPSDGTQVWQFPAAGTGTIGTITSSPAIGKNGSVYFGSYDGNVYAVKPDGTSQYGLLPSGAPQGVQTGETIDSSPAIGQDGTVYIGSFNGRVFAIK